VQHADVNRLTETQTGDNLPVIDYIIPYASQLPLSSPAIQPVPLEILPQPAEDTVDPVFGEIVREIQADSCKPCIPRALFRRLVGSANVFGDEGAGRARLAFALFEIEAARPVSSSTRIRLESVFNLKLPDRAEYFWAMPANLTGGRGPNAPESSVSYQDIRFQTEIGGPKLSVITEIPLRVLDPTINLNTAGLADMNVATKVVLLDGENWLISQISRTYLPTGAASKGLSSGHVAIEPGLLVRYKWNDMTYIHSELKYWFAVGGNPVHSGQVLRFGLGTSHVHYENDVFAIIPTLEWVMLSFLDGQKTPFPTTTGVDIDSEFVSNLFAGIRFVSDSGGDFGLFELGINGGFSLGSNGWYDGILRLEFRWTP